MPTPPSPGFPRLARADRARRVRFRRAVTLMLMTLVLPGSAQLVAGNRRVGRLAMRVWLVTIACVLSAGLVAYAWHGAALWAAFNPTVLVVARWVLILGALGWALLFVDAWRLGQPLTLQRNQRLAMVGVNGVLCLSVAGTLIFGAHVVGVQRDLTVTLFSDGEASSSADGRYNVLLMGGDSGAGRWGLRPDSLTVASIDARTGRTVLVGLPRNMTNFPFADGSVMDEQFPRGFDCDGCYLNGVSTWAGDHTELFGKSDNPGIDATITAVEGITGLEISYWAMVNLQGFKDLVDAVGGVTLNVRQAIPVGLPQDDYFRHIQPGVRKLDGMETLWFARARYDSDDYSRMARQKCVMSAMLTQVSPQAAIRNFRGIAEAGSSMIATDLPQGEVDRFAALALEARTQPVSTVSLVPPRVNTADPDIREVRAMVESAIEKSEGEVEAAPTKQKKRRQPPASTTGGSIGSLAEGYAANESEDLGASC
jgi:LCP family protein required for cell wall assembly